MIAVGAMVWLAVLATAFVFRGRAKRARPPIGTFPPVTILKPVCGLEKHLRENLRTACRQDYPTYQVVVSVHHRDDPAIPLLRELAREFGPERVTVAIEDVRVGFNGKINNLAGGLRHARHDVLLLSDSDLFLRPDYVRTMVAPLADPDVGAVCAFYRATNADHWYERMELLTLNVDQFALAQFAHVLHLVDFCFGPSIAIRRQTLAQIGGFEGLADYLVEDYEIGRRVLARNEKVVAVDYVVDTMVDLRSPAEWWRKMTYWDQNTRAGEPALFTVMLVLRVIPLGLLFAALRGFDALGLCVLGAALGVRLAAAAVVAGVALRHRDTLRSLWLVPLKDTLSLCWFVRAHFKRSVTWRGVEMGLTPRGRLVALRSERPAARRTA